MVTYVQGDIFKSPAQVITNTVNCVGVMGAGIALEFKNRYPALYLDYKGRCERGEVKPGMPYLFEDDQIQVLNFPTKRHWKEGSRLEDIEAGLKYLAIHYREMGINSLALPPLGCGLGGLQWSDIKALIHQHLADLMDLEVFVYEPVAAKSQPRTGQNQKEPGSQSGDGLAAQPSLFS